MPNNRIRQTLSSAAQNLSGPVAALAAQYGVLPGVWALAIAGGAGLLVTYAQLAEDRGKELLDFIQEHQDEFVDTIVNSPEFITVFVNVWELHIRETAENKRKRLRNFLLSLGSGQHIAQDLHTKIYSVIQQMTDQEAAIFGILFNGSNREQFRSMHINPSGFAGLSNYPDNEIKDAWHSLHAYRLIDVMDDGVVGGIMSLGQITPFGEMFYDRVVDGTI